MAAWHGRAVMAQRDRYKDEISYNLALAIALRMGNDDSAATMAIRTLAADAHCHYNTADKRTKEMEAEGLLIIERGEGKLLSYKIPGDFENDGFFTPPPAPLPDHTNDIERLNSRLDDMESKLEKLCDVVEKLSHDLHTIVTSSSHDLHTVVTRPPYNDVNKEVEEVEEEIHNARARGIPPYELPSDAMPFSEHELLRDEIVMAIMGTVKTAAVGSEDEFERAAEWVIKRGVDNPEVVRGFREWWHKNGYYKGKPALKSFLDEFSNYLDGVTYSDGGGAISEAWNEVKAQAANGRTPHFSDSRILEAVRPLWGEVKAMNQYNEREIRAKFERSYTNAVN